MINPVDFGMNLVWLFLLWVHGILMAFVPKSCRFKDVNGQVVLITGGGSGIGQLVAKRLAKRGATIVIWDVNEKGMAATSKDIKENNNGRCHTYKCDVSNRDMVYAVAKRVVEEVGKVDILWNNAGIVTGQRFLNIPDEKIEMTMNVNHMAHFWTVKAFLPDMVARNRGHIVTTASIAGLSGACSLPDYSSSKFANIGFHESLNLELQVDGHDGVKTTLICPWFISTGLFAGSRSDIIPFLEPEHVATEIEAAILIDQTVLYIPRSLYVLAALKAILPWRASVQLAKLLKVDRSMDTFHGRKQQ